MKEDEEFEMLLDEIPHATSSLNLHPSYGDSSHLVDFNHTACSTSFSNVNSLYDDDVFKNKYGYTSSPVSGFSLQSDGSSSSLFSNGGRSISDIGSVSPPYFEDLKTHRISGSGLRWDFKENDGNRYLFDDFNLSSNFSKMYITDEQNRSVAGTVPVNFDGHGGSRGPLNFDDPRVVNFSRSRDGLFANGSTSTFHPQFYRPNMIGSNNFPLGFAVPEIPSALNRPSPNEALFYPAPPNTFQFAQMIPHCNDENLIHYGRNKWPLHVRIPTEDSLIFQGEGMNYRMMNRGNSKRGLHYTAAQDKSRLHMIDSFRTPRMFFPFSSVPSKCNSLAEVQGYIYHIAKDQDGCRFLQRMFDEGTYKDVQIIFNEIIDHVVELMMNPFGNYLMQKLLDVCNEEQKMHVLLRVTEKPGELVRISLNTHGTRVVQKLVETLTTKQQKSLVISSLEPGFLALIKDLNGNHVIQRCLQCFNTEDSEFIFVAAAKYCVEIATHQHGCCVLQRCINRSTGELHNNLIAEISANGFQLAQDAYGNYVVQYILDFKIPSISAKLTSQFEGNYVHLSMQKFSSHVVEKCLRVCNGEIRSKVIHELLYTPYFEQLLQDPHANYVVQTALRVSEGYLHNSLVSAIESYKAISRNSPYSKRIFSHKLLKR